MNTNKQIEKQLDLKPVDPREIDGMQLGYIGCEQDPVRFDYASHKYYFWCENWLTLYGPFNSKKACEDKLKAYARLLF